MKRKLSYIWDYYKPHIFITCLIIYIICFIIYHMFFVTKPDLYMAFINVTPGSDTHESLVENYSDDYVYTYENLLLTEKITDATFSYAKASEVKILGAISDKKLDIVILDKEALDAFIKNEYLLDLNELSIDVDTSYSDNYAINLSECQFIKDAGFPSDVYLGVIANTTNKDGVVDYISYILSK